MADNFSFRSSMNGFNRNDVMAYIDSVLAEKAELLIKVATLEKDIEDVKSKCEEEINSHKTCLAESAENQYKSEIEELKSMVAALEAEKQQFQLKEQDKCSECDIAKVYEARLGAAMLDAKRFSEILVKEANDKASDLFADAFSSAHATSVKAGAIAESITDISNQFNVSFKVLLDNMKALGNALDSFKSDVKLTGDKFDFTTDFVSLTAKKKEAAVPAAAEVSSNVDFIPALKINVNFDDADEYDFRVDVND